MLIIFDCDGVLVDSESLASKIFSVALGEIGISMSAEQCFRQFQGQSLANCFRWLEKAYQRDLPSDFGEFLDRETQLGFEGQLKPVAGVKEVLTFLRSCKRSFCVASNGGHEKIEQSLTLTGLIHFFDNRFSVDDVEHGKPAPDLFLHAAKTMGYEPEDVLVIEDSRAGWEGATSAGMDVFVYAPHGEPSFSCEKTFSDMRELYKVFESVKVGE